VITRNGAGMLAFSLASSQSEHYDRSFHVCQLFFLKKL